MRSPLRLLRREEGFGLLEVLITSSLVGILMATASMVLASTVQHSGAIQEENVIQTELRGAVDRFTADLRSASTGDSTAPVETIGSSAITFLSPDRSTPYRMRRLYYRFSGGQIDRALSTSTNTNGPPWTYGPIGPYDPLLKSVAATSVHYRDESGAITNTPANVRTVDISVTVAPKFSRGRQFTYATAVTIRSTQ